MAAHGRLKNEFTEDEKCHNFMRWLIFQFIIPGTDKIDQMLSKCGDVRNAKVAKSRRNNNFVDPKSDTFNYNLVKGKPFNGDFHTGAPSGAGSHFAIYPGTKWCGYENVAESMEDLGMHHRNFSI